ncbi:MAG: hypothetical protein E5W56_09625 [Mesorhizobium sp.]|nr:MAG: hypothetical protein E5W56_09625 [Mesorhizobium sp.]
MAIIGYAKRGSMTLGGFDDGSLATGVVHTFDTDLGTMRWLGHSCPGEIDELVDLGEFETSNDPSTPLGVWYGGMMEACKQPDRIIAKLK